MYLTAIWKQANAFVSGLSPVIYIYRLSDETLVVNGAAMTEIGATGLYYYNFAAYDNTEEYIWFCDGGAALPDRYTTPCSMFIDYGSLIAAIKAKTDNQPAGVKKNVALDNFSFTMISAADHITPKTGLSVTAQISKDGGAFAACTNLVVEKAYGSYKINFTQNEMNADIIELRFTATGADPKNIVIKTSE